MANVIRIKRRANGNAGAPASLKNAELAFNEVDNTLYYGKGDSSGNATSIIAIGGPGAYLETGTTRNANLVYAGPSSGSAAAPTFRALVAADLVRLDQITAPLAAVSLNSYKITNLANPTSAQDAATKSYVDSLASGLKVKTPVKAATTANITLSGTQTIDGVALSIGDRVLVKNQTTAADNGIYVVASSTWTRATDADTWSELVAAYCLVENGTTNKNAGYITSITEGGTLGTTAIDWTKFSQSSDYSAGDGLTVSGTTFNVVGTTNRISVSADAVDISTAYVGQSSITTLGTITTGTWNGTTVGVAYGGTGVTTITGIIKGNGTSAFTAAVAGTDYHDTSSTIDGGTY